MLPPKSFQLAVREWSETFMGYSMREWMRYIKSVELSMPQFSVLMRLYHRGGCGVSEISAHLDVTAAAASQLVDGLVHKGLLDRVEAEHDRRAKQITLSRKGRALLERGMQARSQWMEQLAGHLTPDQQQTVIAALGHLTAAIRNLDTHPEPK